MKRTLAVLLALTAAHCGGTKSPVVLATTTSVANSGLTDLLLPMYQRATGESVGPVPVGSGRALQMLARQQADVAITHAPAQESAALKAHPQWSYRKILYNAFVIVGPPDDPAGVAGSADATDAMRKIARGPARFISRGDESGTHERERQLWTAAKVTPAAGRLVIAGAGMGDTLRVASETGSYTLTDTGTWEQLAPRLHLRVVLQGDPVLLNTYAVIVDPADERGSQFARWLANGGGRDGIAGLLTRHTLRGFEIWPRNRPGTAPTDLPY